MQLNIWECISKKEQQKRKILESNDPWESLSDHLLKDTPKKEKIKSAFREIQQEVFQKMSYEAS